MTREEIIEAISEDKTMPFIQPDLLSGIVDFVIKNYHPFLPSNLDEAAIKAANEMNIPTENQQSESLTLVMRHIARQMFKAGAEWMVGQGVMKEAVIGMATEEISINVSQQTLDELDLCSGDKVVVQIRKK